MTQRHLRLHLRVADTASFLDLDRGDMQLACDVAEAADLELDMDSACPWCGHEFYQHDADDAGCKVRGRGEMMTIHVDAHGIGMCSCLLCLVPA